MNDIQWYIDNKLTHQIHTSSRRAWRACRRRYNWIYTDMYYPKVTPEPLEFGVAFHKAMETFYEPMTWHSPLEVRRDLALVAFKQECDRHLKAYMKLNDDPDVTILESYKTRTELGLGMIKYYCNIVSPQMDRGWTPIRVEVGFEVPIKDPDTGEQLWCKCTSCWKKWKNSNAGIQHHDGWQDSLNDGKYHPLGADDDWYKEYEWKGLPVTYGGRLDALFQDDIGRYWIVDWKTTSRILDEDAEASFLQLDDQITSYVWALSQLGIKVAGFVYVEIKKAVPAPPEALSRKYKGRLVSTDKTYLTTYEMFKDAVQEKDNAGWQMGLYDNHLTWLLHEGPKFTQRHQIHKNDAEIVNAGTSIAYEAMDMIGNPRIYPMPGRFSCNWCLFKQPCLGMNMNEDVEYTLETMFEKKQEHYWEDKKASTE